MAKQVFGEGDIILIEMNGGRCVQAEFLRQSKEGVLVKNGKEAGSEKVVKFVQTFFFTEIKDIHLIRRAEVKKAKNSSSSNDNAVPSTSQHVSNGVQNNNTAEEEYQSKQRVFNGVSIAKKHFSESELALIQNQFKTTVHIAQHDDKYHNAIEDLKQQEIISVNSENKFGRLDMRRPVLTFATTTKVYLFDMVRLGAMKKEMKEIFSSKLPRKVVHSSTELADYLLYKENCKLNSVFDTLIVHFNVTKSRQHISLQKCYTTYFELPDDFVLQKFNYQIRPLSREALVQAALNAILVMKMYWHMIDMLMNPVYIGSKQFLETYPTVEHQVDLMMHMNDKVYPGVEDTELNQIEYLEQELQFLDVNQK